MDVYRVFLAVAAKVFDGTGVHVGPLDDALQLDHHGRINLDPVAEVSEVVDPHVLGYSLEVFVNLGHKSWHVTEHRMEVARVEDDHHALPDDPVEARAKRNDGLIQRVECILAIDDAQSPAGAIKDR